MVFNDLCRAIHLKRQLDKKRRAAPHLAFEPDFAALLFDQLFRNREAEARAAIGRRDVVVGLLKTFKNPFEPFVGDAYAGV